jgi:hypothetical protein
VDELCDVAERDGAWESHKGWLIQTNVKTFTMRHDGLLDGMRMPDLSARESIVKGGRHHASIHRDGPIDDAIHIPKSRC